ncbi:molybdate ABC transporter permease subunit [Thermaerobacter subterraneus]|uniref:Molybdenum transport system permease n=1 Tax=Thermaerobacter subterraneus DSM 13965 TaxID=867903 RepID=K6QCR6_9FIRM|nr:molybdate ABC transporter permease subunit [Thermaerobacter subterraneus]EKP94361.1 molybdate ABC transporter, permease protein [Thermaerobacter subterraneus DSM 13965]
MVDGIQALQVSLLVVTAATVLVVAAGLPLAVALSRPGWKGRTLVDVLVTLPLALPPTVLGFYLLELLGYRGPLGWLSRHLLGSTLIFTPAAAVLAAAVLALPLFVQPARAALEEIPPEVREAAAIDGAVGWALIRHVILPLAWPGVATGVLLAFTRALGEFGATLMVAGNIPGRTQTLSLAIYSAVQAGRDDLAGRLALLLTAVAALSLGAGYRWRRPGGPGFPVGVGGIPARLSAPPGRRARS